MTITLVSYPKSGRSWLRVLFAGLEIPMEFTHLDAGGTKHLGRKYTDVGLITGDPSTSIFLHRDPRDVVVSHFHHLNGYTFTRSRRMKLKLQGKFPHQNLDEFVQSKRWGVEKVVNFNINIFNYPMA